MDPKIVIEGEVKFRGTRKWRLRWGVVTRLSPVADCLHLQLYRDSKERLKNGTTKASLSLEKFIGMETGFTFDKESNTMALICQDMVLLLAFNSRETLLHWQATIRSHLPQEQQYSIDIIQLPSKSKLSSGPARLHIRDGCFALVNGLPPRLSGLWQLPDLRRYGVLNGKFCFEGGSACGRGEGLHVLQTNQTSELMKAFQLASIGSLQPKRKPSIKKDRCNNLSDRTSFCSSSSHSSGTSSISSGNGSYQSSLEYSTPRASHDHCCSVEFWYDKLKILRTAHSGLLLNDGDSSVCSCRSEFISDQLSNRECKGSRSDDCSCSIDFDVTSSACNTLKKSSAGSTSTSTPINRYDSKSFNFDPNLVQALITGHYQVPRSLISHFQETKNELDDNQILSSNGLEMYDVPRKFQQIHMNNSSNNNIHQQFTIQSEIIKQNEAKNSGDKQLSFVNNSLSQPESNDNLINSDQLNGVSIKSDVSYDNKSHNQIESMKLKVNQTKSEKDHNNCVNSNKNRQGDQQQKQTQSTCNGSESILNHTNLDLRENQSSLPSSSSEVKINGSSKMSNQLVNGSTAINSNYVNLNFVQSLQHYQNVGLLCKKVNSTNCDSGRPKAIQPNSEDSQLSTHHQHLHPSNIQLNYDLMINQCPHRARKDDYLEMIPLIGSDDRSDSEFSDQTDIYLYHHNNHLNHSADHCYSQLKSNGAIDQQTNKVSASSSNQTQSTVTSIKKPTSSTSLSDLKRKLWTHVASFSSNQDNRSHDDRHIQASSCPSSPASLSVYRRRFHHPSDYSDLRSHSITSISPTSFPFPVPPPPPPPPLSYLIACRLNRSMESLVSPIPMDTSIRSHQLTITSSDEDIYHASQVRVICSSPFTVRPVSPFNLKRSSSLPNGGPEAKLELSAIPINDCSLNESEIRSTNDLNVDRPSASNKSCSIKANIPVTENIINLISKPTSVAILNKPRSANEYVTLDVDRKS